MSRVVFGAVWVLAFALSFGLAYDHSQPLIAVAACALYGVGYVDGRRGNGGAW